jgi:hypothetical protein
MVYNMRELLLICLHYDNNSLILPKTFFGWQYVLPSNLINSVPILTDNIVLFMLK